MTNQYKHHYIQLLLGFSLAISVMTANAFHTESHFDDTVKHKIVYQLNKAETEYIDHILFSAGAMLRKYGDDIHIVIATIGPGLHLLGTKPGRHITKFHQQRVSSLSSYGVTFQACGNTMKSLKWTEKDLVESAVVVPIGIDGVMKLQEDGYAYISW